MAARLYWEMANPGSKPFDPENPLVFAVGPLVASGAQAATVMSVVGKSSQTFDLVASSRLVCTTPAA